MIVLTPCRDHFLSREQTHTNGQKNSRPNKMFRSQISLRRYMMYVHLGSPPRCCTVRHHAAPYVRMIRVAFVPEIGQRKPSPSETLPESSHVEIAAPLDPWRPREARTSERARGRSLPTARTAGRPSTFAVLPMSACLIHCPLRCRPPIPIRGA